ncbi:Uncharacterised protein [Acinetobacter baumannii]|nr:Uncharacterised protein [Acinetobacter baumannii]
MSLAHDVQQHLGQFAGRYVEYPGCRGHVARPTVGGLHLALQRAGEPHRTEHGGQRTRGKTYIGHGRIVLDGIRP